MIYYVKLLI